MTLKLRMVTRTIHRSLFLLMGTLPVFAQLSLAETLPNREVTQAWAEYYIESRNIPDAIQYINEHLKQDPSDPTALRLLGISYRLMGQWGESEKVLKRSADLLTGLDRGVVLYLLADSQLHQGEVSQAQQTLTDVAAIPGLRSSAQVALSKAAAGATLPPLEFENRPWGINLSVSSGYDTNVLLLPDSQTAGQNPATSFMSTGLHADYSKNILNLDFVLDPN